MTSKEWNEAISDFYSAEVHNDSDEVYRFCFLVTLHHEAARVCTRDTFKRYADSLDEAKMYADARWELIRAAWNVTRSISTSRQAAESGTLHALLGTIASEGRAALAAVDVVGLSAVEAAEAFQMSEAELRRHLARARQTLVETSVALSTTGGL